MILYDWQNSSWRQSLQPLHVATRRYILQGWRAWWDRSGQGSPIEGIVRIPRRHYIYNNIDQYWLDLIDILPYIYRKWRGSINIDNYFLGQIDLKLRQKGWQNHWQRGRGNSRYPISRVLWPANLAAEPVANSVEAKNHGICAGKWYGRAS